MDDLDRLFHQLVRALAERGPDRLVEPIQIAELYQELVPYRLYRTALKLETHQDYEMALLRLLAGEGGYARVEPTDVQEALAREAQAALPDTGAFREFAAARVHLNPAAEQAVLVGSEAYAPPAPRPPPVEPEAPAEPEAPPEAVAPVAAPPAGALPDLPDSAAPPEEEVGDEDIPAAVPAEASLSPTAGELCPYCGGELPTGRQLFYCPFCGGNVKGVHCPDCGTELEVGWSYCITCGKKMGRA
jgi:hypothetical protein